MFTFRLRAPLASLLPAATTQLPMAPRVAALPVAWAPLFAVHGRRSISTGKTSRAVGANPPLFPPCLATARVTDVGLCATDVVPPSLSTRVASPAIPPSEPTAAAAVAGDPAPDVTVSVVSWAGETKRTLALHGHVFAAPLRRDILQRCVEYHRAKRRKGTHPACLVFSFVPVWA